MNFENIETRLRVFDPFDNSFTTFDDDDTRLNLFDDRQKLQHFIEKLHEMFLVVQYAKIPFSTLAWYQNESPLDDIVLTFVKRNNPTEIVFQVHHYDYQGGNVGDFVGLILDTDERQVPLYISKIIKLDSFDPMGFKTDQGIKRLDKMFNSVRYLLSETVSRIVHEYNYYINQPLSLFQYWDNDRHCILSFTDERFKERIHHVVLSNINESSIVYFKLRDTTFTISDRGALEFIDKHSKKQLVCFVCPNSQVLKRLETILNDESQ